MMVDSTGKSLANLGEAFWLGGAAALAPIARVAAGQKVKQNLLAMGLLIGVCSVAIGLWAFVPGLPE